MGRASLAENAKHQGILPKRRHVTDLIVRHYHEISGHSGWGICSISGERKILGHSRTFCSPKIIGALCLLSHTTKISRNTEDGRFTRRSCECR